MNQTRLESVLESSVHMITGALTSMGVWMFIVAPWKGYEPTMYDNLSITAVFACAGFIRGYTFRRFFNAGLHKQIHNLAKKILSLTKNKKRV